MNIPDPIKREWTRLTEFYDLDARILILQDLKKFDETGKAYLKKHKRTILSPHDWNTIRIKHYQAVVKQLYTVAVDAIRDKKVTGFLKYAPLTNDQLDTIIGRYWEKKK